MTARLDVTPKTTEQNRIVRTSKSEAEAVLELQGGGRARAPNAIVGPLIGEKKTGARGAGPVCAPPLPPYNRPATQ